MLKKSKRFASAALAGIMTLSLCQGVMAEEKPAEIGKLYVVENEKPISMETAPSEIAKLYVVKDEEKPISVQINGIYAENLETAPFIENNSVQISTEDAKTLFGEEYAYEGNVAIREIAEKAGYTVGWDATNRAVIAVDKEKLLEDIGEFTLMDKYNAYSNKFLEDNYTIGGDFNFDMSLTDIKSGETTPVKGSGTIDGITSGNKLDMSSSMNFDFSQIPNLTEEDKALIDSLSAFNVEYKMDMETGKIYFKSPELQKAMEVSDTAWLCLDLQEMFQSYMPGFDFKELLNTAQTGSYKDVVKAQLDMLPAFNTVNDYETMKTALSLFNDASFTKNGNVYTSKTTVGDATTGLSENTLVMTVDDNDNVIGYSMDSVTTVPNVMSMTISASADEDNNMVSKIDIDMTGLLKLAMTMNAKYVETETVATGAPEANAEIIDFMELVGPVDIETTTPETAVEVSPAA